jgi:plastocyanin
MRRILLLLVVLGVAVFAAGCGSDNNNDSSSSASAPATEPATTPAATDTSAATPAAGVVDIKMQNISFSPADVTAKVGQTVKWTNEDSVEHNVIATKGEEFKSKVFGNGKTYEYKLDKPGTITYVCTLHPGMQGTITVT